MNIKFDKVLGAMRESDGGGDLPISGNSLSIDIASDLIYHNEAWDDIVASFGATLKGAIAPTWANIGNGIYAYRFNTGESVMASFHMTHDYKPGSDVYPHVHFLSDSVEGVGDTVTWRVNYIVAKGHQQGQSLTASTTQFDMVYTYDGTEVAGEHIVLECSDAQAFNALEPDTLVLVSFELLATSGIVGDIFGLQGDLHYQKDLIGTPNKAPNFYA